MWPITGLDHTLPPISSASKDNATNVCLQRWSKESWCCFLGHTNLIGAAWPLATTVFVLEIFVVILGETAEYEFDLLAFNRS